MRDMQDNSHSRAACLPARPLLVPRSAAKMEGSPQPVHDRGKRASQRIRPTSACNLP